MGTLQYHATKPRLILDVESRFRNVAESFSKTSPLNVEEKTNASHVFDIMDEGTSAVLHVIASHTEEENVLFVSTTTRTFLVQFAIFELLQYPQRGTSDWQAYFNDLCHRMSDLRAISKGLLLTDDAREASKLFFQKLSLWMKATSLRQASE